MIDDNPIVSEAQCGCADVDDVMPFNGPVSDFPVCLSR